MLDSAAAGLLTGLSLIVAIGAQNAFVLRQGLAREHVGSVVAICAVSDLRADRRRGGRHRHGSSSRPAGCIDVVRWLGVAFLTWYGVSSLLGAPRRVAGGRRRPSRCRAVGVARACTALTWLNPHVYLDTVLLLGSIANTHGHDRALVVRGRRRRWRRSCGSAGWASAPGSPLPLLARPRAWQVLDVLIGLTMLGIAVMLALG